MLRVQGEAYPLREGVCFLCGDDLYRFQAVRDGLLVVRRGYDPTDLGAVVAADSGGQQAWISMRTEELCPADVTGLAVWVPSACRPLLPANAEAFSLDFAWDPIKKTVAGLADGGG